MILKNLFATYGTKRKKKKKNEKGQQKTDFSLFNNQTCEGKKKKNQAWRCHPYWQMRVVLRGAWSPPLSLLTAEFPPSGGSVETGKISLRFWVHHIRAPRKHCSRYLDFSGLEIAPGRPWRPAPRLKPRLRTPARADPRGIARDPPAAATQVPPSRVMAGSAASREEFGSSGWGPTDAPALLTAEVRPRWAPVSSPPPPPPIPRLLWASGGPRSRGLPLVLLSSPEVPRTCGPSTGAIRPSHSRSGRAWEGARFLHTTHIPREGDQPAAAPSHIPSKYSFPNQEGKNRAAAGKNQRAR